MLLLVDIGNTHTHLGMCGTGPNARVALQQNARTPGWFDGSTARRLNRFVGSRKIEGACFCSVSPKASEPCRRWLAARGIDSLELDSSTLRGVGIDYPKPRTIGADRLANAVAARHFFGAPAVVVDFGTAVTFDVVDLQGNYAGGIIAPGLSAMTNYLHEKTALLPKIRIREVRAAIGKNTREAMLIGAVHGYRGLVRALIHELKAELKARRLPVVATGGYAALISRELPEITSVAPNLTLDGLRLVWQSHHATTPASKMKLA